MTRRATFTEAELARAIRVADKLGKTAVQTQAGIAFVPPLNLAQDTQPEPGWTGITYRNQGVAL